jgi:hypothetical protein
MDAEGSMLLDLHDEELAARPAVRSPRVGPESEQGQERVHLPFFYVFEIWLNMGVGARSSCRSFIARTGTNKALCIVVAVFLMSTLLTCCLAFARSPGLVW